MSVIRSRQLVKSLVIGALAVATLVGLISSGSTVKAAPATYTVLAGMDTPYGISAIAFGPQTIKVHRGDTITWRFLSFHNVHFAAKHVDLIVTSQIDGKTAPEFNPAIVLPSAKSGDAYKEGTSSGVPLPAPGQAPTEATFSVVMDVEPGTYTYVCDLHPGMIGFIQVVDTKTEIPSPAEAEKMGRTELEAVLAAGDGGYLNLLKKYPPLAQANTLQVSAGGQEGAAAILRFFPESVTWLVPKGFEPHTINIPLPKEGRPGEFEFIMDSNKRPHVIPTDVLMPNMKSGAAVTPDSAAKSGLLAPEQSFTLTFTKPGAYPYFCALHPNMFGTIVVQPPQ